MCAPHAPVPTLPFSNYNNSIFPQQSRQSASEAREVLTHTRLERFKVAVEANDRRRCIPDPDWLCPWPDRYHPSSQRCRSCARPVPLLFHSSAVAAIQTYSCSPFTCATAGVSTSAIAITAGIPPAPTPASPPAPPLASQPAPLPRHLHRNHRPHFLYSPNSSTLQIPIFSKFLYSIRYLLFLSCIR